MAQTRSWCETMAVAARHQNEGARTPSSSIACPPCLRPAEGLRCPTAAGLADGLFASLASALGWGGCGVGFGMADRATDPCPDSAGTKVSILSPKLSFLNMKSTAV